MFGICSSSLFVISFLHLKSDSHLSYLIIDLICLNKNESIEKIVPVQIHFHFIVLQFNLNDSTDIYP